MRLLRSVPGIYRSATAAALIATLALFAVVDAQEKRTASAGQENTLLTEKQPLNITTPPKTGAARGLRYFLADPGRFPGTGGYAVAAGTSVEVHVEGMTAAGQPVRDQWGPETIAGGAIVDIEFAL